MEYLLEISGNVHICAVKQIMVNNLEVMDDSKGPLISKGIFGAFKSTKKATIFLMISALAGISSLKNQALLKLDFYCLFSLQKSSSN